MALNEQEQEEKLKELKLNLREKEVPFFDEEELKYHLERAGNDVDLASYHCLVIKAEECSLSVSGLSLADSSAYWMRLAAMYRPNCTVITKGG
ncbi:hypothetical protein LQE92_08855 [Lacrimispora sp. NSJ-141]|uniref:Uncharacterized protein n=1 Tax=Lientehia hominis TaxID=2897778 RepID=A0AAP2RJ10_9FIRM|nr:hypothetical protein [Lientehia hominis]MCD2492736.1 hypothetical protein [Lientehia hominis]